MKPLKRYTQCVSLTMLFGVFIILFGVSSTALTTFGKPSNNPPPTVGPVGRDCNSHDDCNAIEKSSCVRDPNDYKMRCLCGNDTPPNNGLCPDVLKGLRHKCNSNNECEENMICQFENNGTTGVAKFISTKTRMCLCDNENGYTEDTIRDICSGDRMYFAVVMRLCLICLLLLAEWTDNVNSIHNLHKERSETSHTSIINETVSSTIMYSPQWIDYQKERFKNWSHLEESIYATNKSDNVTVRVENFIEPTLTHIKKDVKNLKENKNEKFIHEIKAQTYMRQSKFIAFIKFLKLLNQQSWKSNDINSLNNKIKLLNTLSENLLKTIEKQFSLMWRMDPDDKNYIRRKRGILDETSLNYLPEASLISITFLTFSVFLIKLVLQVVNIIKSRHYTFSTNTNGNVRA